MEYEEAVEFAMDAMAGINDLPDEADKLAAIVLHFIANGDEASLSDVIELASSQALSYDALLRAVAELLKQERLPPPALRKWVILGLSGKLERPKVPHRFRNGWPGETIERDLMIYEAVCGLIALGINPSENSASGSETSGCHIVSEAARRLGHRRISYHLVRKIYANATRKKASGKDLWVGVDTINALIISTTKR